jgi:hypothetical protein
MKIDKHYFYSVSRWNSDHSKDKNCVSVSFLIEFESSNRMLAGDVGEFAKKLWNNGFFDREKALCGYTGWFSTTKGPAYSPFEAHITFPKTVSLAKIEKMIGEITNYFHNETNRAIELRNIAKSIQNL